MAEQLSLTGATTLTDRQAYALGIIAARQPIRSDDLGAHLHAYRQDQGGKGHGADDTCDWCTSEGKSVGDALAAKGLVRYVRGKGWVTADWKGEFAKVDEGRWEERDTDGSFVGRHATTREAEKASAQLGTDEPWPEDFF